LHDQAKAALENGDEVPGYALSAGRAARQWHNEDAAVGALIRLGLARDDVIANEVVRSPAQVELRAKARGLKVPADLVFSRRSGVSLVRSENVRAPVATRSELARSFTVALEAFQGGDGGDKKPLDERLMSVSQPRPDLTTLPDHGFQWSEQWAVGMKCISGADAGTEVIFKTNTIGGTQAVVGLLEEVRTRLNGGQHAGKVSPIVRLEKYSYPHPEHGRTWNPQMTIVDWMAMDGPAPAPAPEPTPEPEPRRRRVG
jgi:uncharacterized protein DUF2800